MINHGLFKLSLALLLFLCQSFLLFSQEDLQQFKNFGTNPGNLKMYLYDPGNVSENVPLVVVLHGCTQTAKTCAEQTGWNKLAKKHQFYVLYPEQLLINNVENCFNWFRPNDQLRDKGEPASIMQMINYLKATQKIDSTRIYVTGLSAGGAMTTTMLSVFPDVFDKGAVFAGGPYKSAQSSIKGGAAMLGMVSKSPEEWGSLVMQQNPNFKGTFPKLMIVHGGADPIVSTNNSNQLIKQWVNIHQTDYIEDEHYEHYKGNDDIELTIYKNKKNEAVVTYYRIKGMGHALPLDTGNCDTQGGKTGMFSVDKNFHSTFVAANFFGIIKSPYRINGPKSVNPGTEGLSYSIPFTEGSVYKWETPPGVWITNGKNTHSITVSVDSESGYLQVIEVDKNGCILEPSKIWIEIKENP